MISSSKKEAAAAVQVADMSNIRVRNTRSFDRTAYRARGEWCWESSVSNKMRIYLYSIDMSWMRESEPSFCHCSIFAALESKINKSYIIK